MVNSAQHRPTLTPKGERTRARIVEAAAGLIYERGVARTTLEDVRATAGVSGSQAVIDHQADLIVGTTGRAGLGSAEGIRAWRDMIIAQARSAEAKGGCPLGSLAGQVAQSDPQARARIAAGFERWSAVIGDGLRGLRASGHLSTDIDPDDLALTVLAALQGGLLFAQVQRDAGPLETVVDTVLALAAGVSAGVSADGGD
jgi:AcrR family transcriptional regulator